MNTSTFHGENELRKALLNTGFICAPKNAAMLGDNCNWYAYKRSKVQSRRCEHNDKEGVQVVVTPFSVTPFSSEVGNVPWRSVEIEVCGEANGDWWKMIAYGIHPDHVPGKIDAIEKSLVDAWNALYKKEGD